MGAEEEKRGRKKKGKGKRGKKLRSKSFFYKSTRMFYFIYAVVIFGSLKKTVSRVSK